MSDAGVESFHIPHVVGYYVVIITLVVVVVVVVVQNDIPNFEWLRLTA